MRAGQAAPRCPEERLAGTIACARRRIRAKIIRMPGPHSDPLVSAIKQALAQPQRVAAPRALNEVARDGLGMIEDLRATMPRFDIPNSQRNEVALALLLASLDQARTLCYLLATDPINGWYSSLILHRSQIDHFLRGAFFARPATDPELDFFLRKNKLPSRSPPEADKKLTLTTNEVAAIIVEAYGWEGERLINTIRNHWGPLSGIVHGGRELLNAYLSEEGIGAEIDLQELVSIVVNTVGLAHMVSAVLMAITPLPADRVHEIMLPVHTRFTAFANGEGL